MLRVVPPCMYPADLLRRFISPANLHLHFSSIRFTFIESRNYLQCSIEHKLRKKTTSYGPTRLVSGITATPFK